MEVLAEVLATLDEPFEGVMQKIEGGGKEIQRLEYKLRKQKLTIKFQAFLAACAVAWLRYRKDNGDERDRPGPVAEMLRCMHGGKLYEAQIPSVLKPLNLGAYELSCGAEVSSGGGSNTTTRASALFAAPLGQANGTGIPQAELLFSSHCRS